MNETTQQLKEAGLLEKPFWELPYEELRKKDLTEEEMQILKKKNPETLIRYITDLEKIEEEENKLRDKNISWKEAKEILRELYEKAQGEYPVELPKCKATTKTIKILSEAELTEGYYLVLPKKSGQKRTLQFFDDENKTGGQIDEKKLNKAIIKNFYRYEAIAINGVKEEITLFSETPIETKSKEIQATGLYTTLIDKTKEGTTANLEKRINLMIVEKTNAKEKQIIKILQPLEFIENEDDIKSEIFEKYRNPTWFENMLTAWILSTKNYEYPIHILLADNNFKAKQQGSVGKTTLITQIMNKTNSGLPCDLASKSITLKGLTIGHSGMNGKARMGYLLKQDRFGALDEIFQLNIKKGGEEERIGNISKEFGGLTTILDNKPFIAQSGSTDQLKVYPKIKLISVGNMPQGTGTIEDMKNLIPTQFLQRHLIYIYTEEHRKYIKEQYKKTLLMQPEKLKIDLSEFIEFCSTELTLKLNDEIINNIMAITNRVMETIDEGKFEQSDLSAFFENRYPHHALCLLDGIIKKNHIKEIKKTLKATKCNTKELEIIPTEQDYREVKEILEKITESW